jgi:hypothetical protein
MHSWLKNVKKARFLDEASFFCFFGGSNDLGLGEVADFEAQKFNRITDAEPCTNVS